MSKYRNKKVMLDGQTFDSKKEANRYAELKLMQKAGIIRDLQTQVPFLLIPAQRDEHGKIVEREVRYLADFVYLKDGEMVVEDTKGFRTTEYKIKRKLMLKVHGIRIKEV